jgi:hypothetical protein
VSGRAAYPSDLTDEQRALDRPFLAAWKARRPSVSGIKAAISYARSSMRSSIRIGPAASGRIYRTTCRRSARRHYYYYYYYALWRDDGTDAAIHGCRAGWRGRRPAGPRIRRRGAGHPDGPAANHVPAATTGKDAANYPGLDVIPGKLDFALVIGDTVG